MVVQGPDGFEEIAAKTVVLACGGFEANAEMRTRYLGPGWELAKVRGVPYNTGDGIRMALDIGAQSYGHWSRLPRGRLGPQRPPPLAIARLLSFTRSIRTPSDLSSTLKANASWMKGRLPQLYLCCLRTRNPQAAAGRGVPDLR